LPSEVWRVPFVQSERRACFWGQFVKPFGGNRQVDGLANEVGAAATPAPGDEGEGGTLVRVQAE